MQAERQQKQFEQWMKNHNLKPLPTESLIAIGSPSTILKTNAGHNQIFQKVLHAEHIPNKILELGKYYQCAEPILTPYLLRKVCDLLLLNHTPAVPNILESYQVPKSDIITGVQCPYCHQFPMRRIYGAWSCQHFERKDKSAHKQAIQDYFLLHHRITNEECRHFLQIASSQLATRLLSESNFPCNGAHKARVYHLKI